MLLRSLEIENIRSYAHASFSFEEGITLLAGDIGAGKSTVLAAIEFSLFGIGKGDLAGAHLLRHGCARGSVTLRFQVGGAMYAVHRVLRKGAHGVVQEAGWIESAGQQEALTANELRARIFALLGYPLQFLAKKNVLFRNTIYTPQEEMKAILTQSSQDRIESIRRIFGVDAYKRMQENAQLTARKCGEEALARAQALERSAAQLAHMDEALSKEGSVRSQLERSRAALEGLSRSIAAQERSVEELERTHSLLSQEQATRALRERSRAMAAAECDRLRASAAACERKKAQAHALLKQVRERMDALAPAPQAIGEQLEQARSRLEGLHAQEGKVLAQLQACSHLPAVQAGEICPSCKQQIAGEHARALRDQMRLERTHALSEREAVRASQATARQELLALEQLQQGAREREMLRERVLEQERSLALLEQEQAQLARVLAERTAALEALQGEIKDDLQLRSASAAAKLREGKSDVLRLRQEQLALTRTGAQLESQLAHMAELRQQRAMLEGERALLGSEREQFAQAAAWLLERFVPFAGVIERHVLSAIHTSFNAFLQQTLSQLVGDEALQAHADGEFTVLVTQDGFDVPFEGLSGGERSALALSYRLALVRTMHALLPELGAAGLLLLDEPTEGFSPEQLARLEGVLRSLRMEQVLMVSHETMLEGGADRIVRISRSGSGSFVLD